MELNCGEVPSDHRVRRTDSSTSGRLRWVCGICVCLAWAMGTALSAAAEDWPRWRGPRADGTWQAPVFPPGWKIEQVKPAWKQSIGGGYGGISVVGPRLFVMDRQKTPHEEERILCRDTRTGMPVWEHRYRVSYGKLSYGNGPRATPTVDHGRVYTLGSLGHACCLDAETGKLLWSKDPQADLNVDLPEWGLAASPVIFEDLVILHPGGKQNGCLIAVEQKTGKERWRSSKDPAGYATPILIQHHGNPLLIAWTPQHILGIDPRRGTQLCSIPYPVTYGVSISTPHVVDDIVVVCGYWEGSKGIRLGASPTDAKLLWEENKFLRGLMAPPLSKGRLVYMLDKQYGLTCFDIETGKKRWDDKNQMTPRGRNPQANFVWLDRDHHNQVLCLNSDGALIHAEFRETGYHERGRVSIIGETWAAPAFAGNWVFARSDTELCGVKLIDEK